MPNPIQALAMLPNMSQQQLLQALQANDGSVPSYAIMAELQARKKRAAGFVGAGAPPSTSVKQDMVSGGLQSIAQQTQPPIPQNPGSMPGGAPMQMPQGAPLGPQPQGMAAGGKIKAHFDDGGQIDDGSTASDYNIFKEAPGAIARGIGRIGSWLVSAPGSGGLFDSPYRPSTPAYPTQHYSDAASYGPGTSAPGVPATPSASPSASSAAPSGLRSISASAATRTGGVAPTIDKYTPKPVVPKPWSQIQAEFPTDNTASEQMKAIKDADTSSADRQNAKWEALARMGIGMARTPGSVMTAFATGAGQGLDSLSANNRMIQQNQMDQRKELTNLAIAQGAAKSRDYMAMKNNQYQDAQIQNMNNVDQFNVWKANLESGDKAAERATQIQVASIHAAAAKAAQQDFNMMRLVQNTQATANDDFEKAHPANGIEYLNNPQKKEQDRAMFIAARMATVPGLGKYYVAPQGPAPSTGGFMSAPPQGARQLQVNWGQ